MFFLQILLNSFVLGTQVLLLALGLYLVYTVARVFHVGLGAVGAAVAYATYFGVSHDWPIYSVVGLFVLAVLILGYGSYRLLDSFSKNHDSLGGIVVSLSLGVGLEALASIFFGTDGKSFVSGVLGTISWGSVYLSLPGALTIVLGIVVAILAGFFMRITPWGRVIRGISEHPWSIRALGINQGRVRLGIYLIATFLAGSIVFMTALNNALVPLVGFNLIIMAFVALLVGGVGDIRGTIIASYIVTLIPELIIGFSSGAATLTPAWRMALVFVVAIAILWIRPHGILASRTREQ